MKRVVREPFRVRRLKKRSSGDSRDLNGGGVP
jgi:hypothetical protein